MIETHAHIYDSVYDSDIENVLQNALSAGVQEIWMPNCASETIEAMRNIAEKYPVQCFPMMGLHPCYVKEDVDKELAIVRRQLEKYNYSMIGEIGLDYYWDISFEVQQEKAFWEQLNFAREFNLPICIHSRSSKDGSRNAVKRCVELIEKFNWQQLRGIFHCFSGTLEEANRIISLHFKLGIGGTVTYKNSGLERLLKNIALEHLVLETDSPYLAPVPFRGKRNEPSFLIHIAQKIADIQQKNIQEVIEISTESARSLRNETLNF